MPEDKVKSPVLILVVLILVSLFLAGGVFYLFQKEKANNLALVAEVSELREQQKTTEARISESKKTISALEVKLQEAQGKIDVLTQDLEQERSARQDMAVQANKAKVELEEQKKLRLELDEKLTKAQQEMKKLQAQLQEQDSKRAGLETKIKDLEAQMQQPKTKDVELGKIVVVPEGGVTSIQGGSEAAVSTESQEGTLEGKILVVNKEYNFAVVNLGSKDNIHDGDLFAVYHGNNYLGDIKINKIHDSMSAAAFTSMDMKEKLSEGDRVVQKTK